MESSAKLVINASAYTAVDKAETEAELSFAVNRDGPTYLAKSCSEQKIPLIHISTDYVFDGKKQGPYRASDPVSPQGVYGKSKVAGENAIRECLREHIILRTAWLYGVHGNNFVKTMLRLGKEYKELNVVNDQYGCPTCAADLAQAIFTIAESFKDGQNVKWGTYHYCGKGKTTWYDFTEKIIELAKSKKSLIVEKINPLTTEEYPTPAKRPANSTMDCTLLTRTFGIHPPHWEESLIRTIQAICEEEETACSGKI